MPSTSFALRRLARAKSRSGYASCWSRTNRRYREHRPHCEIRSEPGKRGTSGCPAVSSDGSIQVESAQTELHAQRCSDSEYRSGGTRLRAVSFGRPTSFLIKGERHLHTTYFLQSEGSHFANAVRHYAKITIVAVTLSNVTNLLLANHASRAGSITLVFFRNEPAPFDRLLIVVAMFFRTIRQSDFLPGNLLIRNHAQQVRDAIQTGLALII